MCLSLPNLHETVKKQTKEEKNREAEIEGSSETLCLHCYGSQYEMEQNTECERLWEECAT